MTDDLPVAVWSGSFKILGVDVKCHTLSDGRRIVDADSAAAFVRALQDEGVPDNPKGHADLEAFAEWQAGK